MESRFIIDSEIETIVKGKQNTYKAYSVIKSNFSKFEYQINGSFIYIIARQTFISENPKLDYLSINISNNLKDVLSINTDIVNNSVFYIFMPLKKDDDYLSIISDIKAKHVRHGINEEPFGNSL